MLTWSCLVGHLVIPELIHTTNFHSMENFEISAIKLHETMPTTSFSSSSSCGYSSPYLECKFGEIIPEQL